jgi:hypothetical protein
VSAASSSHAARRGVIRPPRYLANGGANPPKTTCGPAARRDFRIRYPRSSGLASIAAMVAIVAPFRWRERSRPRFEVRGTIRQNSPGPNVLRPTGATQECCAGSSTLLHLQPPSSSRFRPVGKCVPRPYTDLSNPTASARHGGIRRRSGLVRPRRCAGPWRAAAAVPARS